MNHKQPEPAPKSYSRLIGDITDGIIKIPQFQRDFVWSKDKTAKLLDSILKGYPIGTFIFWKTDTSIRHRKDIGGIQLKETPKGDKTQFVLDGQQRITSLFAAYEGVKIPGEGNKKPVNYREIFVNLDKDLTNNDDQIITSNKPEGSKSITLCELLNLGSDKKSRDFLEQFDDQETKLIDDYKGRFENYPFSTILLLQEETASAVEVFERLNTGGEPLTLFEIMCAKTYDEVQDFDMQEKWEQFIEEIKITHYDGISSTVILYLLSLMLSDNNECRKKVIFALDKQEIIDSWDSAISSLKDAISHFKRMYRIPVSELLPYDFLLVPFAYFFHMSEKSPNHEQKRHLEKFFWKASLSYRYTSAVEARITQDARRMEEISKDEKPNYSGYPKENIDPESLIDKDFRAGESYCKAVLCLLAGKHPKNFSDDTPVALDNSWLKRVDSKNFHHFFPRGYLGKNVGNSNSIVNITLISDDENKNKIRKKAPSEYIGEFEKVNKDIADSLASHYIGDKAKFGIDNDDYEAFLNARAEAISQELRKRVE